MIAERRKAVAGLLRLVGADACAASAGRKAIEPVTGGDVAAVDLGVFADQAAFGVGNAAGADTAARIAIGNAGLSCTYFTNQPPTPVTPPVLA